MVQGREWEAVGRSSGKMSLKSLSTRPRHRSQGRLTGRRGRERAGGPGGLVLHLGEAVGVVGEVGEDHSLLVVVLAQDLVVAQEESVAHAESVVALLAGEALQVVDVGPRPHHHLKGRNHLLARRAVTRRPEQPEVISLAEDEVPLGEERGADLSEATVAAAALEAVLVPVHVQRLQQVPVLYLLAAAGALLRACRLLRFGLHRHGHFAPADAECGDVL